MINPFDTPKEAPKGEQRESTTTEPSIDEVLATLKRVWEIEPGLNLGALIWGAVQDPGGGGYMFMLKDAKMIEALNEWGERMDSKKED